MAVVKEEEEEEDAGMEALGSSLYTGLVIHYYKGVVYTAKVRGVRGPGPKKGRSHFTSLHSPSKNSLSRSSRTTVEQTEFLTCTYTM